VEVSGVSANARALIMVMPRLLLEDATRILAARGRIGMEWCPVVPGHDGWLLLGRTA